MGYESRLYVINRVELKTSWDDVVVDVWGEKLAMFNMCCVGWDHTAIFKTPIDFPVEYTESGDPVYNDLYGKRCCMASVSDVISAVEALEEQNHYRRFNPLLGFLRGLNESEWGDLRVVHFGY